MNHELEHSLVVIGQEIIPPGNTYSIHQARLPPQSSSLYCQSVLFLSTNCAFTPCFSHLICWLYAQAIMDVSLRCNNHANGYCRKELSDEGIVTSCS